MRCLRNCVLAALGGLLCGCESQQPEPNEGAYVDFVIELMVASTQRSEVPSDSAPAVQAVQGWRGGEGEDDAE